MDNGNKILHDTSFCACLEVLLMKELTGICGNQWECFAAPLGLDSDLGFFSHFSVCHCHFHLFSLNLFSTHYFHLELETFAAVRPRADRDSSEELCSLHRWELLTYSSNGNSQSIFPPALAAPDSQQIPWVSHEEWASVQFLFSCF